MRDEGDDAFYKGLSYATRIGVELVAGTLVGAGIGYFIDWKFKTTPWGIVIGVLVGSAAGFLNIYRFARTLDQDQEEKDQPDQDRKK